jgi:pyridoxine kinase
MLHPVLTIQSHVAYGYVGNTAAVFPLQLLGFSPVVINTVQFSNHTNHPTTRGMVFTAEHIRDIILGVRERGLMPTFEGLLSGYLGDVTIGDILLELASEIKSANPNAIWCCDPVMGDTDSGVFVRPGIPEFMKKHFLNGLADMTTPNQFELELFAERPMKCRKDAIDTARSLFIKHGCKVAFITSLRTPDVPADKIETVAVTENDAWIVQTPFLSQEPVPKGQGDVFASVAFGVYLKTRSAREALEHATSTLYGLVKASPAGSLDLPLIDDQKDILTPSIRFTAVRADE